MSVQDIIPRMLANLIFNNHGKVTINDIECGKYTKYERNKQAVHQAKKFLDTLPIQYINASGKEFEEILSTIKRWRHQQKSEQVLVILDYLKIGSTNDINKNIAEFQALGFRTMALHDTAVKLNIPVLTLVQLNRSGSVEEDQTVIAFSDRIIHTVTSFSILKDKSPEEIAATGIESGTKKLVVVSCRHGKGLDFGDFINLQFRGEYGILRETSTLFQIKNMQNNIQIAKSLQDTEQNISLDN